MAQIPREKSPDSTLALMRDPYLFISKACQRHRSDLFETRIMLRKAICMTGPDAAALFYNSSRFVRHGAMPGRIQKTLLGQGGVQGLDGDAHRRRKQMFMSLMTAERIEQLGQMAREEWVRFAHKWLAMEKVVLYDELHELLTRAACAWAGVPLAGSEVELRTQEIRALFDYAGLVGPKHWWSRLARKRADRWAGSIIDGVRAGRVQPAEATPTYAIAWHRDLNGELLSPDIAGVELLNVIRPTVAVSVYITFVAHALHEYPECRRQLEAGEEGYAELFVQEVRRFYPFFPAVGARVQHDFEWRGYQFPRGRQVILDLHGTNHDPRVWDAPETFRPERFREWDRNPFNFVPQGGGDHYVNHRCPGEWITIELMKVAAEFLARRVSYEAPEQDFRIDWTRLPALPRSRFIINNVRETWL